MCARNHDVWTRQGCPLFGTTTQQRNGRRLAHAPENGEDGEDGEGGGEEGEESEEDDGSDYASSDDDGPAPRDYPRSRAQMIVDLAEDDLQARKTSPSSALRFVLFLSSRPPFFGFSLLLLPLLLLGFVSSRGLFFVSCPPPAVGRVLVVGGFSAETGPAA